MHFVGPTLAAESETLGVAPPPPHLFEQAPQVSLATATVRRPRPRVCIASQLAQRIPSTGTGGRPGHPGRQLLEPQVPGGLGSPQLAVGLSRTQPVFPFLSK